MSDDLITAEVVEDAARAYDVQWILQGQEGPTNKPMRAALSAVLPALLKAAVERAMEACAKLVEPSEARPCDCERCYCGNPDDVASVAVWDALTEEAKRIRARMKDNHGAHFGDPCIYCGTPHDKVAPGPCPAAIRSRTEKETPAP